jgi:hypothetical protein
VGNFRAPISLAAAGPNAYVAYEALALVPYENSYDEQSYIRMRQSSNNGRTWSPAVNLSPLLNLRLFSKTPVIAEHDGRLGVIYMRCSLWFQGRCDLGTAWSGDLVYRQSRDGANWTRAKTLEHASGDTTFLPLGLDISGPAIALYTWGWSEPNEGYITRRGV